MIKITSFGSPRGCAPVFIVGLASNFFEPSGGFLCRLLFDGNVRALFCLFGVSLPVDDGQVMNYVFKTKKDGLVDNSISYTNNFDITLYQFLGLLARQFKKQSF